MAVFPTNEAPQSPQQAAAAHPINIEAWTEHTTAAMASVTISVPGAVVQNGSVALEIPLDELPAPRAAPVTAAAKKSDGTRYYKRKEPLRRDSMKQREALLKGKEGSRRRQRWENDRLLSNPHAEPPTARDWEVHPTYPVQHVPYYLAPLWDAGLKQQSTTRKARDSKAKLSTRTVATKPTEPGVIPKELREKLKRSRGAKGLLMDLESEVRKFVASWEEKERRAEAAGLPVDPDSEDDEIVFVGRNGAMRDAQGGEEIKREMMVFETEAGDQAGTFGRWLVHHIGTYYGLRTWSVTRGDPARREAYIGLKEARVRDGGLPRPLWGLV